MPAKKTPTSNKLEKPVLPAVEPPDPVKRKASPAKPKKTAVAAPKKAAPAKPADKKSAPAKVETSSIVEAPAAAPESTESTLPQVTAVPSAPVSTQPTPAAPVAPVAPIPPMASIPTIPSSTRKPDLVQTIAIITLVNGILNILFGLGLTLGVVLGTFFFGILCAPVTILPSVLGIFEILYAVKLLSNQPQPVKPSKTIAILEICCILTGNLLSLVAGILALVFYEDGAVKAYFARINSMA